MSDLRFACRQLLKNPGFTVLAVLTLALGIGACTAMFSLINAALIRDLPFPDADRLVVIWADNPGLKLGLTTVPPANSDIAEWREQSRSFAQITAFLPRTVDLADGGDPERIGAAAVTAGFFETLGIHPLLGRTLARDEEPAGAAPVALIGHGLWQRRFGGDPKLVGRTISINGGQRTVIGILPPEFDFPRSAEWPSFFAFPSRTEIWLPLAFGPADWQRKEERGMVVLGRLKADSSRRQAQVELDAFSARQAKDYPDSHQGWSLRLTPLHRQLAGGSHTALLMLFAAVGLLLLIACVNVALLLLARGVARRQEMAVRAALGAAPRRLIRQLLTECFLLAALGSALGLLFAAAALRVVLALHPAIHSRLSDAHLDPMVLGFTALTALVTSAIFGLVPARQASRIDLRDSLQEGGRGAVGPVREGLRAGLVAAEVALAIVLLAVAGLMVRSLVRVQAIQPGFRPDAVLAFDVQLPSAKYPDEAAQTAFFRQLTSRLEEIPDVRAAGAVSFLPLGGGENMGSFAVEGEPPVSPGNEPTAERRLVTPGYFAALGIPIRRGRVFQPTDTADQPRVVVINETLARRFFASHDPVGLRMKVGRAERAVWRIVVGVVADVKSGSLERDVRPQLYLPHAQWTWAGMTVVLRTEGNPLALLPAARRELKSLDPFLPAANVRTMQQVLAKASSVRRFNLLFTRIFHRSSFRICPLRRQPQVMSIRRRRPMPMLSGPGGPSCFLSK
jgi:putative ABC transport system permease protein